ncbi:sensor histidine kinase [Tropicimonas sp. IMCC6043]|uniref:sensor histidine kinase n=1 Tax=Tropicimonas sp. IMCC6043 TaxID=2510645 RepID=UPI00101DA9D0|nr:sensor histidine kinase [Tropicimonas sp. IMCC6043]RYH06557.1 sensor histidine kinase [Tropicimonas sp. IMCC6043]
MRSWRLQLPGEARLPFRRGLSLRLAGLLSLVMLPLGVIAVWQTAELQKKLTEVNALNLISLTGEVARKERETIEAALGGAAAMAAVLPTFRDDPARCADVFGGFLEGAGDRFSFAGYVPVSGQVTCSSFGRPVDVSDRAGFRELVATRTRTVLLDRTGPISGQPVLVASLPVGGDADSVPEGYVTVSIPHVQLENPYSEIIAGRAMDLFTINAAGEILTASGDPETAAMRLPGDRLSQALLTEGAHRFTALNGYGMRRVYSVVPIAEGAVYAVGAWLPTRATSESPLLDLLHSPALFPIVMWVASLVMVMMAVEWLLVRHVRVIAVQLRRFARNRELPVPPPEGRLPNELEVIEREFGALAERLVQDEAELMDAMHDKDVLLKEVHHRVKNNLQLISSIVSMQVRRTADPATAAALQRVNRRVSSMATVHRRLYQAENLGRVRADDLLRDVILPLVDLVDSSSERPRLELRLDPVTLYPDQAVPAALLSVEAATNALKYLGPDGSGERWLRVELTDLGSDQVRLAIVSSLDPERHSGDTSTEASADGTGLGSQLIRAFARQLEAEETIEEGEDSYTLSVVFESAPFTAEDTASAEDAVAETV